jgi:SsrA-binding protein
MEILHFNKRASFEYSFIETYIAGIELKGSEVKSIRDGKSSITESYCTFRDNELFITNMHISEYKESSYYNHEPYRERKLLLNRKELDKLASGLQMNGLTIVPVKLILTNRGLIKLEIALAKGKKLWDRRNNIKEREANRDIERNK